MAKKTLERQVRIAGRLFVLRSRDVEHALRNIEPEPITSHFVVVGTRRFPPKHSDAPTKKIGVGGALVTARAAEVGLCLADQADSYEWSAPVWFCEPWTPAFGLLGLTGFFDQFEVTIASYQERIELVPVR